MAPKKDFSVKPVFDEEILLQDLTQLKIKNPLLLATKIWRLLIQSNVQDFKDIPELPKSVLNLLTSEYTITSSSVISCTTASDGSTTKLLLKLDSGHKIESVIMRYGDVSLSSFPEEKRKTTPSDSSKQFKSNKRATLCVSSQVGCAMACTFCATGTMGLKGNLSPGEILEQLYHANKIEKIRNIVFMGMGEPLDSYHAVILAIKGMTDTARFGLSPSRISVSTVGVIPRILQLIKDAPQVGLALSLHAPNQKLREQIVPTAKAWPIQKLISAAEKFVANQNMNITSRNRRRRVLVEYVIIKDVNDSDEVARELGELLRDKDFLLNVIPYNPTAVDFDYHTPDCERVNSFVEIVRGLGVHTLLRQTMGSDVNSACGQLVINDDATELEKETLSALAGINGVIVSKGGCSDEVDDIEDLGSKSGKPMRRMIKNKEEKIHGKKNFEEVGRIVITIGLVIVGFYMLRKSGLLPTLNN